VITDESLKNRSRAQAVKRTHLSSDNLNEVLLKVLEFSHARQRILALNIRSADKPGFIPKDLPCAEFAGLLNIALDEHVQTNRLLFTDTDNIKFFPGGCFEVEPVADNHAKMLLKINKERYIQLQVEKVVENSLNLRFAAQLLWERRQLPAN
jgi:flagellar basal body rod protein FlgB